MRLFIGIAPDDDTRCALARTADALRGVVPGRYADPALYHLTLVFLGEQSAKRLPRLELAMQAAVRGIAPFALSLGAVGTFGSVLWRGVEASGPLERLAASVRESLTAEGIAFDSMPFRAHFTLARDTKALGRAVLPPMPPATFTVDRIILYESTRQAGTLAYTPHIQVLL